MIDVGVDCGMYTAPRKEKVGSVDCVIVDSHNDVFSYVYNCFSKQGILIHIDDHDDLSESDNIFNHDLGLNDYAKQLSIASFLIPLFFEKKIGVCYWINPRHDFIFAFGRFNNGKWFGGTASGLTFNNGFWYDGVWLNGTYNNGFWYNGLWLNGTFNNGYFKNGLWKNGTFNGGYMGYEKYNVIAYEKDTSKTIKTPDVAI